MTAIGCLTSDPLTVRSGAQILAERQQHVVLKLICDRAGMDTLIDLEVVGDAIHVQQVAELATAGAESILVTNIDCNPAMSL